MKVMILKDETFVTDAKGKRVGVVLDLKTYERLRESEEELAEVRAYDATRGKVAAELRAGQFTSLADYSAKRASRK